jgi:thioesterase domain-containing protein
LIVLGHVALLRPTAPRVNSVEDGATSAIPTSARHIARYVEVGAIRRDVVSVPEAECTTNCGLANSMAESQHPFVFLLQKGGTKTPLYFISAGGDEPRLAKLMGSERPIYGIQIPWPSDWLRAAKSNDVSSIPRLEEFVRPFVEVLHEHQRSGPCILAGHSFAGLLAFEVGRQLQMRGGKVEAVVVIDKQAQMEGIYRFAMRNLRHCWSGAPSGPDRLTGKELTGRIHRFALTLRWLLGKAKARVAPALLPEYGELTTTLDAEGVPLRWPTLMRFYRHMHRSYCPTPLDSRGIVIRVVANDRYASIRTADKHMGWNSLFIGGVVAVELTGGNHNSIIREKAEILASAIVEAIALG